MHAVQRLYQFRKSISTKPFNARGKKVNRCELCRVSQAFCICSLTPKASSEAGFLLLMYDTEVLKPSNTGRLIADIFPDTYAYLWSRTEQDPELISLLQSEQWQPIIVFPQAYVEDKSRLLKPKVGHDSTTTFVNYDLSKRPLFILLDGSWREAKKMFRKSAYLANFPVISFDQDSYSMDSSSSYIRCSSKDEQLATAQVAAQLLNVIDEPHNGKLLSLWYQVFNFQYQRSVCQPNQGDQEAIAKLTRYLKEEYDNYL